MGLDMYLYVEKYESLMSYDKDIQEKFKSFYPKELEEIGREHLKHNFLSKETRYQVGYWRKANAIHKWFVDNCGDEKDNCQLMYVSNGKIKELLREVEQVLDNKDLANDMLPTTKGFFFGSQEYDEWYFEDLKYTKELLKTILDFLEKNKNYQVYYQASW